MRNPLPQLEPHTLRELKNKYQLDKPGKLIRALELKVGDTLLYRHTPQTIEAITEHKTNLKCKTDIGCRSYYKGTYVYISLPTWH